jgi:anti-sigma regulatory factor (Ser/Thr protein kinase)
MSRANAVIHPTCDGAESTAHIVMQLERARTAGAVARRTIRTRLDGLVARQTRDDVLLVVSELLANAVLHGSGEISLRVELDRGRVVGRVTDEGRGLVPRVLARPTDATGAHGLHLVDCVATWGVAPTSADVWFEIDDRAPV